MVGMIQGERERIMVRLGHALRGGGGKTEEEKGGSPSLLLLLRGGDFFLSKLA